MQLQSGQNIPLHTATLTLRLDYPPVPDFTVPLRRACLC